jgi:hypothetical protein
MGERERKLQQKLSKQPEENPRSLSILGWSLQPAALYVSQDLWTFLLEV